MARRTKAATKPRKTLSDALADTSDLKGNGNGAKEKKQQITISAPNMQVAVFKIVGTAPYVQNKFSKKAMEIMRAKQAAGSTATKGKKREAKDFKLCYEESMHKTKEGWCGIPAAAFRCAMISACRTVGFKMTLAKLCAFVIADGHSLDGTPLVKLRKGKPRHVEHLVRIQKTTDIRARAMWDPGWEATVRVEFDADQFTPTDIANLMMRVGVQVGVGEGRPDSKDSAGMGWGLFKLKGSDD
jgi:hypothetical protein